MYLVYVDGDTNSPYQIENQNTLFTYLATIQTPVIVEQYDMILKERTFYNMTGAANIPNVQKKINLAKATRTHIVEGS